MQTFNEIKNEVGEWSQKNFGQNTSRSATSKWIDRTHNKCMEGPLNLDSLAPLMGMMEELGEMFEGQSVAERRDAVGDIMTYACDYAYREGIDMPVQLNGISVSHHHEHPRINSVKWLGRLFQATLKRHQGIRGMDNVDAFRNIQKDVFRRFLVCIHLFSLDDNGDPALDVLNEVWHEVVKKRDFTESKHEDRPVV